MSDSFAGAEQLTPGSTSLTTSNASATTETGEPMPDALPWTKTLWFKWTAPADDPSATFTTFGSSYDTLLALYKSPTLTPTFADLVFYAYNDDNGSAQSQVVAGVLAGETWWIQVGGYGGASGTLVLNYPTAGSPPAPGDVDLAGAITADAAAVGDLTRNGLYASVSGRATVTGSMKLATALRGNQVKGRASVIGGLTVVRHRTLEMFVTVGLATDNHQEAALEAASGDGVRQVSGDEPEVVTSQTARFV